MILILVITQATIIHWRKGFRTVDSTGLRFQRAFKNTEILFEIYTNELVKELFNVS